MKTQAPKLSQEYIQPLADVFKVLGDPTRLRILRLLMDGEVCVRCISEELGMGQSAVSHQLRILRDARLVQFRREERAVFLGRCPRIYAAQRRVGARRRIRGAYVSLFNAPRKGTAFFFKKAG